MRRLLVISLLMLLVVSAMLAAGCGSKSGEEAKGTEAGGDMGERDKSADGGSADVKKEGDRGAAGDEGKGDTGGTDERKGSTLAGTYESDQGTYITLGDDGTFESDAWGGTKSGIYKQEKGGDWIRLLFDDGSSANLSVMTGDGGVHAIVDDDTLIQYTRK